ncbi:MAG: hypothetical protein ABR582_11645 [Gemmatimonadaceae bacterium]
MATTARPARRRKGPTNVSGLSAGALKCRKKFLRFFHDGFYDETYLDWERNYKWEAHERWEATLGREVFLELLSSGEFKEAAKRAVTIESRTNLLFSFEKMALRDAVKSDSGARAFSRGLFDWIYGDGGQKTKFENWCDTLAALPRKQTRVFTWPLATVFGFIALPEVHIFLKPMVTRAAAADYGFDFQYRSRPNWGTYQSLLDFATTVRRDVKDLDPRDNIDIQSFIWVQGSDEY